MDDLKQALKDLVVGLEADVLKILKSFWATYKDDIAELQAEPEYVRKTVTKYIYKAVIWGLKISGVKTTMALKNKIRKFLCAVAHINSF